jgi:hypothetical protein
VGYGYYHEGRVWALPPVNGERLVFRPPDHPQLCREDYM